MTKLIYKICAASLWDEAEAAGVFLGAGIDLADGYIHFSSRTQVADTARLHFSGQNGLVLVSVDADELGDALKWEASRGGDLFPHLYGSLPVSAVRLVRPLPLGADGTPQIPALEEDR